MNNSSFLIRILFCYSLLLFHTLSAQATTITWDGPLTNSNWHTASNWDPEQVPTVTDSVIITGGNDMSILLVDISSDVVVRHITIDEYCTLTISQSTRLEVSDAPGIAIKVEQDGSLVNRGTLEIYNASTGILGFGNFENDGDCTINGTSTGVLIHLSSISKNQGSLSILNSIYALSNQHDSQFTNEGQMYIENCFHGISNQAKSTFYNNGSIDILSMEKSGISNESTFINNGPITLKDIDYDMDRAAIYNKNISYNGETHIGHFENKSNIVMSDIKGTAIVNDNSTTFLISGIGLIYVQEALEDGLVVMPMSTFTITQNASLIVRSMDTPIDIHEGGIFDVAVGAFVNILN